MSVLPALALSARKTAAYHFKHTGIGHQVEILLEHRKTRAWLHPHSAIVRRCDTSNQTQQRRFALAVSPDDTNTLALADAEIDSIEQGSRTKG